MLSALGKRIKLAFFNTVDRLSDKRQDEDIASE